MCVMDLHAFMKWDRRAHKYLDMSAHQVNQYQMRRSLQPGLRAWKKGLMMNWRVRPVKQL